jgi:hypothetical protein
MNSNAQRPQRISFGLLASTNTLSNKKQELIDFQDKLTRRALMKRQMMNTFSNSDATISASQGQIYSSTYEEGSLGERVLNYQSEARLNDGASNNEKTEIPGLYSETSTKSLTERYTKLSIDKLQENITRRHFMNSMNFRNTQGSKEIMKNKMQVRMTNEIFFQNIELLTKKSLATTFRKPEASQAKSLENPIQREPPENSQSQPTQSNFYAPPQSSHAIPELKLSQGISLKHRTLKPLHGDSTGTIRDMETNETDRYASQPSLNTDRRILFHEDAYESRLRNAQPVSKHAAPAAESPDSKTRLPYIELQLSRRANPQVGSFEKKDKGKKKVVCPQHSERNLQEYSIQRGTDPNNPNHLALTTERIYLLRPNSRIRQDNTVGEQYTKSRPYIFPRPEPEIQGQDYNDYYVQDNVTEEIDFISIQGLFNSPNIGFINSLERILASPDFSPRKKAVQMKIKSRLLSLRSLIDLYKDV